VPLGTDVFPLTCFRNVPGPAKVPQDPSSKHFATRAPQKVLFSPVPSIALQHLLYACLQVACLANASSVETPRLTRPRVTINIFRISFSLSVH